MQYNNFKDLFSQICEIKKYVVKLNTNELRKYKILFYKLKFPLWRLNLMWEYIWGDIEYDRLKYIFESSNVI